MTSSSASRSTWRTLYGSSGSDIFWTHPDVRERDRERAGLVRRQTAEEIPDDIAEGGSDGQRQDRPEEPGERPTDDDREDDGRRVQLHRVALDLRDQEVVLHLLDEEVQQQCRDDRHRSHGRREQDSRHGGHDRPDDRHELEQTRDDGQQDRVSTEDGIDQVAQHDEADEGREPDREAEQDLAADPLPEVTLDRLDDRPRVEPPRRRQRPIERGDERCLATQDVGDPDGQDEVREDRAEEAACAGDQREQEREVRPTPAAAAPALPDARDERVDPVADRGRDLQVCVELAEALELEIEAFGELREVLDEPDDLVDERRQRQGHESDEGDDADDVDDDDRDS